MEVDVAIVGAGGGIGNAERVAQLALTDLIQGGCNSACSWLERVAIDGLQRVSLTKAESRGCSKKGSHCKGRVEDPNNHKRFNEQCRNERNDERQTDKRNTSQATNGMGNAIKNGQPLTTWTATATPTLSRESVRGQSDALGEKQTFQTRPRQDGLDCFRRACVKIEK